MSKIEARHMKINSQNKLKLILYNHRGSVSVLDVPP